MGRKKVCPDVLRAREQERKETFGKRCRGLFKKAHELAAMCGCELQLSVHAEDGRLYHLHRLRNPFLNLQSDSAAAAHPPSSSSSDSSSASAAAAAAARPNHHHHLRPSRLFYNHQSTKMEHCPPEYFSLLPLLRPPNLSAAAACLCFDCVSGRSSSSLRPSAASPSSSAAPPPPPPPPPPLNPTPISMRPPPPPPIFFSPSSSSSSYLPHFPIPILPSFPLAHSAKPEPDEVSIDSGAAGGLDLPLTSCDSSTLDVELKAFETSTLHDAGLAFADSTALTDVKASRMEQFYNPYDDDKLFMPSESWDYLDGNPYLM